MRVLHLAESFSAGVATAIEGYLDNSPADVESVVCGYRRPGVQVGDGVGARAKFIDLPQGKAPQFQAVRRVLRAETFDVLHLHSSWAGLFGRVGAPRNRPRIVYTPHCFAFDRLDLGRATRVALRLVERALGVRLDAVGACSVNEMRQARALLPSKTVVQLPYVLPSQLVAELTSMRAAKAPTQQLDVCVVGRVDRQKDPEFCTQIARILRADREPVTITWIGGGRPELESQLRDAGVDVTGWTDRATALQRLAKADVYLHTAAWEGLPLTLLEAATLDVPMALRRIPALDELDLPTLRNSPADIADAIRGLRDDDFRESVRHAGQQFLEQHQPAAQTAALTELYRI